MMLDPNHPDIDRTKVILVAGFVVGFFISAIITIINNKIKYSMLSQVNELSASEMFIPAIGGGIGMAIIFVICHSFYIKLFRK